MRLNKDALIKVVEKPQYRDDIPDFRPGDTVRVVYKVKEGNRTRLQSFEGTVIKIRRNGLNTTFTVRKISHGVGVERIFPIHSPLIEKMEVTFRGKVRRAKLYYLRERRGKAARIKPDRRRMNIDAKAKAPSETATEEAKPEAESEG